MTVPDGFINMKDVQDTLAKRLEQDILQLRESSLFPPTIEEVAKLAAQSVSSFIDAHGHPQYEIRMGSVDDLTDEEKAQRISPPIAVWVPRSLVERMGNMAG